MRFPSVCCRSKCLSLRSVKRRRARERVSGLRCTERAFLFTVLLALNGFAAPDPPPVPIGYDAYIKLDKWPYQRIGVRAYMRSTYDRRGGNEGADASHFLYQLADDYNVALDVEGPGILYFARYNHWHGS